MFLIINTLLTKHLELTTPIEETGTFVLNLYCCAYFPDAESTLQTYISTLPQSLLEKELDWDSEGVDKDLVEIADKMIHWEEKGLHSLLELSHIDVHDIKDAYRDKPVLQRCVKFKVECLEWFKKAS